MVKFISNPFYATAVSVSKLLRINNRWIELISTSLDFASNLIDSLIDFLLLFTLFLCIDYEVNPNIKEVNGLCCIYDKEIHRDINLIRI